MTHGTASSRIAIYTCVTAHYDVVLPPLARTPGADYLLFTDDPGLRVRGWENRPLAPAAAGLPPNLQNRYHKLLPHKVLPPDYDVSIYLDANLRVRRDLTPLLAEMAGFDIGLFPHELRNRVADEVEACIAHGKIRDATVIRAEYDSYRAAGFPDAEDCLSENAILFRRHGAVEVIAAMEMWWDLVASHSGRDQISLPFVLWKTGLKAHRFGFNYRKRNPWFHRYGHWKNAGSKAWLKTYATGRRVEGIHWRGFNRIMRNL